MGMTLKQIAIAELQGATTDYCKALEAPLDAPALVAASLRLHIARGNVPRSYDRASRHAIRQTQLRKSLAKAKGK